MRGYPTILFLNPKGEKVDTLRSREAPAIREQILQVIQQHSATPELREDQPIEAALAEAREQKKLLAVVFRDPDEKAPADAFLAAVLTEQTAELRARFHWIVRPLKDGRRTTDEAKAWKVTRAPTLLLVDPWADEEKGGELDKISNPRRIAHDLEKALEDARKAGHPPE